MSFLNSSSFSTATRGVIRLGNDCSFCGRPEPILGKVGKGRPLASFAPGYLCLGHTMYVS